MRDYFRNPKTDTDSRNAPSLYSSLQGNQIPSARENVQAGAVRECFAM